MKISEINVLRSFEERVALLTAFAADHGRLPRRPAACVPEVEGDLGRIVNRFRDSYRLGKLDSPQITAVETIGSWKWRADAAASILSPAFAEKLAALKAWVETNHGLPTSRVKQGDERVLADWCHAQRTRRIDHMTDDEFVALESIPGWFWEHETQGAIWFARAAEYAEFLATHTAKPRKNATDVTERSLGRWAENQRMKRLNSMLPPLTAEQITVLEVTPGWEWTNDRNSVSWNAQFTALLTFVTTTGTFPTDTGTPADRKAWSWMNTQRSKYIDGQMPEFYPERVQLLEQISGWVWRVDIADKWLANWVSCAEWALANGKIPSQKSKDPEERRLGGWAGHCRRAAEAGQTTMKLTPARIGALNLMKHWYWTKA